MRRVTPAAVAEATRRIERWLLESDAQLSAGAHRGGVAGWLDAGGRPEFVYFEITGYYLTAMAWLGGGAASGPGRAALALERGRRALEWIRSVTADGALPPTRLYLGNRRGDWRNAAVFSFDLAMATRGVACFASASPADRTETLLRELGERVHEVCADTVPLASHRLRDPAGAAMPERWSTRPGPHHAKAAAALLGLPAGVVDEALLDACHGTLAHWTGAMRATSPCRDLHPMLYGLEGLLIAGPLAGDSAHVVEPVYRRLMALQAPDGTLPAAAGGRTVRTDVLAQALRIGALLRAGGRLPGGDELCRLDALAGALLKHVGADGGVAFSTDHDVTNTWCAMFALQALVLYTRGVDGASPAGEVGSLI